VEWYETEEGKKQLLDIINEKFVFIDGEPVSRNDQPERSKREDPIKKVVPDKLTRGMAIKSGKFKSKLKKMDGVGPDLLGCGALNTMETS
jgi:hypothetical protein